MGPPLDQAFEIYMAQENLRGVAQGWTGAANYFKQLAGQAFAGREDSLAISHRVTAEMIEGQMGPIMDTLKRNQAEASAALQVVSEANKLVGLYTNAGNVQDILDASDTPITAEYVSQSPYLNRFTGSVIGTLYLSTSRKVGALVMAGSSVVGRGIEAGLWATDRDGHNGRIILADNVKTERDLLMFLFLMGELVD